MNALELGASVKMSSPLGVWKAEASARLFSATAEYDDQLHLAVETSVELKTYKASPHLDADGLEALKSQDPTTAFYNVCGDAYVGAITKGARFRALLTSHDHTVSKQVEKALGASGRYAGAGSAALSSAQDLKAFLSDSTYDVEVTQSNGPPLHAPMKFDDIIGAASDFACRVNEKTAGVVGFTVYPYSTVVTDGSKCITGDNRWSSENALADRVAEAREKQAIASFVAEQLYPVWGDSCNAKDAHEKYRMDLGDAERIASNRYADCLTGSCVSCNTSDLEPLPTLKADMNCALPGCKKVDRKSGFCIRCEEFAEGSASKTTGFVTSDAVCRYMRPGADVQVSGDFSVLVRPGSDPHGRQCRTLQANQISADVRGVIGGRFNVSPQTVMYSHGSHAESDHRETVSLRGWGSIDPSGSTPVAVSLASKDCQCMDCDHCSGPPDCTFCSATSGAIVICSGDGCGP